MFLAGDVYLCYGVSDVVCVCVEVDGGIGVCTPVGYLPPENGLLKWGNIYTYIYEGETEREYAAV